MRPRLRHGEKFNLQAQVFGEAVVAIDDHLVPLEPLDPARDRPPAHTDEAKANQADKLIGDFLNESALQNGGLLSPDASPGF